MTRNDLLITWFCLIDDGLKALWHGKRLRQRGPEPTLADSEVITMEIVEEYLESSSPLILLDIHHPWRCCRGLCPKPVCLMLLYRSLPVFVSNVPLKLEGVSRERGSSVGQSPPHPLRAQSGRYPTDGPRCLANRA